MRRRPHLGLLAHLALLLGVCAQSAINASPGGLAAASATSGRTGPAPPPSGGVVAIHAGTASAPCPTTS
jgi:hypothetical protein